MRFLLFVVVLAGLSAVARPAWAECSCLCLDGVYQPVCTAEEEVGQNRGLCLALASQSCPVAPDGAGLDTYDAPMEGVSNCREAQVFDGRAGDFVTARVCDVAPET